MLTKHNLLIFKRIEDYSDRSSEINQISNGIWFYVVPRVKRPESIDEIQS